jgi:hypothetical protein
MGKWTRPKRASAGEASPDAPQVDKARRDQSINAQIRAQALTSATGFREQWLQCGCGRRISGMLLPEYNQTALNCRIGKRCWPVDSGNYAAQLLTAQKSSNETTCEIFKRRGAQNSKTQRLRHNNHEYRHKKLSEDEDEKEDEDDFVEPAKPDAPGRRSLAVVILQ